MKKVVLVAWLFAASLAQAQVSKLDKIFDQYQNAEGITSIKIAKPMFRMVEKLNIADDELKQIKPIISKMNSLKILIVEDPQKKELQDEIQKAIDKINYEELMTVNSHGNKIKFMAENAGNADILKNLVLAIRAQDENGFVDKQIDGETKKVLKDTGINTNATTLFLMLDGEISMEEVSSLINQTEKQNEK